MSYKTFPREELSYLPTPLIELPRLAKKLGGPRLLMKRDDQTGVALGGNKARKLEFLVGDALKKGCDVLITGGAQQSNHCRQTAAAAAAVGLECHLMLGGVSPEGVNGNLLLDLLLGSHIHYCGEERKGEGIPALAKELEKAGKKPYIIPYGGSNVTGSLGFVAAVDELSEQLSAMGESVTHIIFPSGSGGTHAGLVLGKELNKKKFDIVGIAVDKGISGAKPFQEHVQELCNDTAELLGTDKRYLLEDIILRTEFCGEGYGVIGDLERRAITMLAETEGILLDPVYTGRAMGALIEMVEAGELTSNDCVLFWHTGGAPGLFAYSQDLV